MEFSYIYPTLEEIELYWSEALFEIPDEVEPVEERERETLPGHTYDRHVGGRWLRFEGVDGVKFWCFWQPCNRPGARKTLIHVPGYGTEISAHPSFVYAGYNVMHINPRGYCGPDGFENPEWRSPENGGALVITRNLDKPREYGYRFWFQDAVIAIRWLQKQPYVAEKFGFFGTSQGGGGSLLLGSILASEGIVGAVAADVPYLTAFSLAYERGSGGGYEFLLKLPEDEREFKKSFHTLGYVDTVAHGPRMKYPVLLTIGADDETCPAYTIYSLYEKLPHTRAVVELHGQGHAYTPPFPALAEMWFKLYL